MESFMSKEGRKCPYCGKILKHPYWVHIQESHPLDYQKNETWIQLFNDYTSMGMDHNMSIMVIAELFNTSEKDIEEYLQKNNVL